MSNILPAGTPAPDFTLQATPDQTLALKGLRGRPVILAFYPADWSPVCGDQMALYNEVLPEFHRFNAELLGISVDGGRKAACDLYNWNSEERVLLKFYSDLLERRAPATKENERLLEAAPNPRPQHHQCQGQVPGEAPYS